MGARAGRAAVLMLVAVAGCSSGDGERTVLMEPPVRTPVGVGIVFPGGDGLYGVNPDGTGLRRIADGYEAVPSPDGRFVATPETVVDARGKVRRRLPAGAAVDSWSPDGRFLLYTVASENLDAYSEKRLLDVRTGRTTTLEIDADARAVWSPDGTRLAYADYPIDGEVSELVVTTRAGEVVRRIAGADIDEGTVPAWSPDGDGLAFARRDAKAKTIGVRQRIFVLDVASGRTRPVTRTVENDLSDLAWAPGREILFSSRRAGFASELYAVDPETRRERRLTRSAIGEHSTDPSWSPDARRVVFLRSRFRSPSAGADVFVVNADGAGLRAVASADDVERTGTPRWIRGGFARGGAAQTAAPRVRIEPAATLELSGVGPADAKRGRVAVVAATPGSACGDVVVWSLPTDVVVRVRGLCGFGYENEIVRVALGGDRLAWVYRFGERQEIETCILVWSLRLRRFVVPGERVDCSFSFGIPGPPAFTDVEQSARGEYGDGDETLALANLHGGREFFYNVKAVCSPVEPGACGKGWATRERIVHTVRLGAARIEWLPRAARVLDVDDDRVLTLAAGRLELRDRTGSVTRLVATDARTIAARLAGASVARLTADHTLWIHAASGSERRLQIPAGATLADAASDLLLYADGASLGFVRPSDGAHARIVLPAVPPVRAAADDTGVFVAFNVARTRPPGRVLFYERTAIDAALDGARRR